MAASEGMIGIAGSNTPPAMAPWGGRAPFLGTNPLALAGALLPMGGAKGYALALAVEVLAAVLTGAGVGPEVPSFFDNWTDESNVGHALVAIDVAAFMDPAAFAARMEGLIDALKTVPPAAGSPGVLVPGERRAAREARARAEGLRLPAPLLAQLDAIAAELGAPPLER